MPGRAQHGLSPILVPRGRKNIKTNNMSFFLGKKTCKSEDPNEVIYPLKQINKMSFLECSQKGPQLILTNRKMHIGVPLNFLFLLALLRFLSACVSSASSLISPFPAKTSSGASIAASEMATGATCQG